MDTKPELIRLEPVDPTTVPGNMYIKNEVLYNVETPAQHIVKKEDTKVYYEGSSHHNLQETKPYIPDTVHNYQTKPISQYPKYQTPKLRAKSTYSPIKAMNNSTPSQQLYMKQEQTEHILGMAVESHPSHIINSRHSIAATPADHNATIQVITPNTNYGAQQQWHTADVNVMTPVMEQTSLQPQSADVTGNSGNAGHSSLTTPDAIFIPETAGINSNENSSNYNAMNAAATINLIPVMTPNGLVFVAANNTTSGTVISGVSSNNAVETIPPIPTPQQQTPTPTSRSYNRRKQMPKRTSTVQQQQTTTTQQSTPAIVATQHAVETISPDMINTGNASNLVYTQNGQVLLVNENRTVHSQIDFKPIINTPTAPLIPEKGTVIEEPPKAIYQSRYSDINENSTQYNSKSGSKICSDAELDLDAAITVFKIYK